MAFTVTPTSGDAPYVYTADFTGKDVIDGVSFSLEARTTVLVNECFLGMSDGVNSQTIVDNILNTGSHTSMTSVGAGFCRTVSLIIRNMNTGMVVDYKNITIDNT